jgi:hypothetical protein
MTRWKLLGAGVFFAVMWFACWAVTTVPGSLAAAHQQWTFGNGLAFLAGAAFGAAAVKWRSN